MATMANILVKDDAGTPTEFTLTPISDVPSPFWRASVANVPLEGQPRLTLSVDRLKNQGYKITAKLEVPTMETLGASGSSAGYVAPPKVAYVTTAIMSMFVDRRSTIADRANTLKMLVGILQGASSTTATGVLANTAAGDAWKNSVLPGVVAFTNLVLPS